jgi:hypothetical protein
MSRFLLIHIFVLQMLLWPLISGWSEAGATPWQNQITPGITAKSKEDPVGASPGIILEASPSAGGRHFPLRMDLSEDSAAS